MATIELTHMITKSFDLLLSKPAEAQGLNAWPVAGQAKDCQLGTKTECEVYLNSLSRVGKNGEASEEEGGGEEGRKEGEREGREKKKRRERRGGRIQ